MTGRGALEGGVTHPYDSGTDSSGGSADEESVGAERLFNTEWQVNSL